MKTEISPSLKRVTALAVAAVMTLLVAAADAPKQVTWNLDNLTKIGGAPVKVEGHPKVVASPVGKAIEFNGVDDMIFVESHPLAGLEKYTFEAIFRPDGGDQQQRWFHLAEIDPKTGLSTSTEKTTNEPNARFLFEIRVNDGKWYLDAFMNGPGYNKALMFRDKVHPVGQWYHVAQVFDGKTFSSYVNGELQGQAEVTTYKPQMPGRTAIGSRQNRVNYFKGAVAWARFTPSALSPSEFRKLPAAK